MHDCVKFLLNSSFNVVNVNAESFCKKICSGLLSMQERLHQVLFGTLIMSVWNRYPAVPYWYFKGTFP